jgi:hypothetical protein
MDAFESQHCTACGLEFTVNRSRVGTRPACRARDGNCRSALLKPLGRSTPSSRAHHQPTAIGRQTSHAGRTTLD